MADLTTDLFVDLDVVEPSAREFPLDGTIDFETADWDRFVLGCVDDGVVPRIFYDVDELIDHVRTRGGTYWAHGGGVFDFLLVLERCRVRGIPCQVDRSQHRVSRIVMGRATLRDSYGLWPVPLDEIAGAIGEPVPSLPWACTCRSACGGYCEIARRNPPPLDGCSVDRDIELEIYCKADCRVLYNGLAALDRFATKHKIGLYGTMGQTAWKAAQRELGVPDSDITWALWRHVRKADRGGRGAIIRPREAGPGTHHDICNAYPAQLAKAHLPVGEARELGPRSARVALEHCEPGIYTCTVAVADDQFLPPLPWMIDGQMAFPTGQFTGTWTLPELAAAFVRGVDLIAVESAVCWEATAPIFEPLVRRWYDIRRAAGRKSPFGKWVGRLAKTATGKFAERPERSRVVFHPATIEICARSGKCATGCTGRCGAYEQLDFDGDIWSVPYAKMSPSAYPQWSAYLRAMTRIQWLEQAERYGTDLVMGNTDSLWTRGRMAPEPLGDDLGQWEFQVAWRDLDVRSLGNYAYTNAATGERVVVGIPGITPRDWERGHGTIERGIVTFGKAVQTTKGLFTKRARTWSLPSSCRQWYGDRKMGNGGVTYAVTADELAELGAARKAARAEAQRRAESLARKLGDKQKRPRMHPRDSEE